MKIQLLTTAFNGMTQRIWVELDRLNHEVRVHIVRSKEGMIKAVNYYKPQIIIAPFLMSKIPKDVWKNFTCLIVHPGIKGDRGASSLDWAILRNTKTWGVTILQAVEKMDAGPVWASNEFEMRQVSKGEIYRNEVTQGAVKGILESLIKYETKGYVPKKLDYSNPDTKGRWNNKTTRESFKFSWGDKTKEIINKINAADSSPGVLIQLFEKPYFCFGAHLEKQLKGKAGEVLAQRNGAICVATGEDAIWLTHLKSNENENIKLPATIALNELSKNIPLANISPFEQVDGYTWQEIRFEQFDDIGYLHFEFYNGAMSTDQCKRLKEAFVEAKNRTKLIVLMGGRDVWSNGIHLNVIENANNPADESWHNINAIDDLILEIIQSTDHYIICALQGNAGAGGVSLALSGDKIIARDGIVLNPHTKNMGLYGSEYWTYLLPKRIGMEKAKKFTEECLPWGVSVAKEIGLIDDYLGQISSEFITFVKQQANTIIKLPYFEKLLQAKMFQRRKDEMNKPLEYYRNEELTKMKANFYNNDMDFNMKRHCFVHKIQDENSQNIDDLYVSRRSIYRKRKWESVTYKEE